MCETRRLTKRLLFTPLKDNLRYSFDYCVFGDPQSEEIDSNPCATSEGCGSLTDALRKGMVNSTDREQYGSCEVDEQAIKGEDFDQCLSCVSAESTHSYLSNCKPSPYLPTYLPLSSSSSAKVLFS